MYMEVRSMEEKYELVIQVPLSKEAYDTLKDAEIDYTLGNSVLYFKAKEEKDLAEKLLANLNCIGWTKPDKEKCNPAYAAARYNNMRVF